MKKFLLPALLFLCCACEEPVVEEYSPLAKNLVGEWRNIHLKLDMQTFRNSDSNYVFEVSEQDWEKKMNIRPIRTFYREDGTYNSLHLNLRDSVVYNPAGTWKVVGDSLFMQDTFPVRAEVYRYKLRITNKLAEFTGVEDGDRDGKKDDLYFGRQWKQ